jgi:PAS domain S-box-containing protein
MNYRFLSLVEDVPEGFIYIAELTSVDVRRRPFALFAADLQSAKTALAPFGTALSGVIVTFGDEQNWHQLTPFLIHIAIPQNHQHQLPVLLHSNLTLLENIRKSEDRNETLALNLTRSLEDNQRSALEFKQIKESLLEELSERKLTEAALKESEERFRTLMEDVPGVSVQGYALDGTVLFWNQASESLYGYSAKEALGANLLDLIIPEEMKNVVKIAVQEMKESGISIHASELLLKRKDGSRVPVYSSHAIVTPVGRQPELFCLDVDLTEQKLAQEQLAYSMSLTNATLESTLDGILVVDRDGKIARWNQKFIDLWNVPEELLVINVKDPVLKYAVSQVANPDQFLAKVMDLYEHPEDSSQDQIEIKDGRVFDRYSQPIKIGNEIVGRLWAFRDMTARIKAEEQIRDARNYIQTILSTSPVGIETYKATGETVSANDAVARIVGTSTEQLLPQNFRNLESWKKSGLLELADRALDAGSDQRGEFRVTTTFGKEVDLDCLFVPFVFSGDQHLMLIIMDITKRKLAEEELLYSNSLNNAALESSSDGILVVDSYGEVVRWNQKFVDLWRIPVAVLATNDDSLLLKHAVSQLSQPEEFMLKVKELYEHPEYSSQDIISLIDGRLFDRYSQPFRIGDEIVGRFWSFRDITEQKKLENEVRHQLHFTETILGAIPNPVFFKDTDGRYIGCNKAYEELRGITKDELFGKCVFDIAMSVDAEALHTMDTKLLACCRPQQYETSLLLNDGSRREVIYHKACFKNISGEPAGLIGVIQDVTTLKLAQTTIKKHNEELEQRVFERTRSLEDANCELHAINSELEQKRHEAEVLNCKLTQLSSAVENSPTSIVITDYFGNIEYVNPMFSDITGYLLEEVLGQNPRILKADDLPKEYYIKLWETISAGHVWSGDFCNRKKNGDKYWEHASISPIKNDQGIITHFVAIKEDITQQKRIAGELLTAQEAAHAASRSKSEFLANMSHEIRTPLSAIIGFSDLTLRTDLQPRQQDYLQKIKTAGELLLSIINDILDFSKIEARQLEMEYIPFALDTLLANVTTLVQQKVQEKRLNLLVEIDPNVPNNLIGDQYRLSQIVVNLINNAVKFTEQGGVVLETSLLLRLREKVKLQFSIRDTGIGISEEQIADLFKPFTQADGSTTRRFGGTGLGLSISKQLVEMMNGEIWCESMPEDGSTFRFTAWFGIEDQKGHPESEATDSDFNSSNFCFSGFRILLAEDNKINRVFIVELLKDTGIVLDIAANGQETVTMITNGDKHYDLVLMDIQMPIMDGYEATRRIKADNRFKHLPIIAVTAHAMKDEHQRIIQAGADAIITKPIVAKNLLQVMNFFLIENTTCKDLNKTSAINDRKVIPLSTERISGFASSQATTALDLTVVTPILDSLLHFIDSWDAKAENYLDDYKQELTVLPDRDIAQLKNYLKKFDFAAARAALILLATKQGIIFPEDC